MMICDSARQEAMVFFERAYHCQMKGRLEDAIELYQLSLAICPTAEAYTFLGWTYSIQERYEDAIAECHKAIALDPDYGNPYNDIGSYLIAKGNYYDCVRWFKMAIDSVRYEARAYPHFNLAHVYEKRGKLLEAARHYGLALKEQPNYSQAYNALRKLQGRLN